MDTIAVNCNNCGAPLQVGADAHFATCGHCGSRLAVKRSGSAAYTEVLERLEKKTDELAERVGELVRQNELERLDREWDEERAKYLIRYKNGRVAEPTIFTGVASVVMAGLFGVLWIGMTSSMGAPGLFTLFGLGVVGVAIMIGISVVAKAKQLEAAKVRYLQRRAAAAEGKPEEPAGEKPAG